MLWNDTRSAAAAADLVGELGGPQLWADAIGSVPVASFTITKLRWLATHEPESMARTASVCLPHDWLTWQLGRSFGMGHGSRRRQRDRLLVAAADAYRLDLLNLACGKTPRPADGAGTQRGRRHRRRAAFFSGRVPGTTRPPHWVCTPVSATSWCPSERPARSSGSARSPTADGTGTIAGFADATGRFLPLVCTLNADQGAGRRGHDDWLLARPALRAGARRPARRRRPDAAALPGRRADAEPPRRHRHAVRRSDQSRNTTPAHLARAAVEGMLCGLADGLDALRAADVPVRRVLLIGGGARSVAVQRIAPTVFGVPVAVPEPSEYVADGAARQAAWVLAQTPEPPIWSASAATTYVGDFAADVRARYRHVRDL